MLSAGHRLATSWVHYTTNCNTQSSAPEDGQNNSPKHVELIGIINKLLLLHLVGCLFYLYQWCTVKQIPKIFLVTYVVQTVWCLSINRCIPVQNTVGWSAVVSCEGKYTLKREKEFSAAFELVTAVHKLDSTPVGHQTPIKWWPMEVIEPYVFDRIYVLFSSFAQR